MNIINWKEKYNELKNKNAFLYCEAINCAGAIAMTYELDTKIAAEIEQSMVYLVLTTLEVSA